MLVLALFWLSLVLGSPCSDDVNFPSGLKGVKIPIKQTASEPSVGLEISGFIEIIDKCSFQPKNFTLRGAALFLTYHWETLIVDDSMVHL
jgi:hypothetical protein